MSPYAHLPLVDGCGAWRIGLLRCRRTGVVTACYLDPPDEAGHVVARLISGTAARVFDAFPSWEGALHAWEAVRRSTVRGGLTRDIERYH